MKIGSSFDTKLKQTLIEKYANQYGKKDIIVVSRSMRYLIFYCILPTIALIARITIIGLVLSFDTGNSFLNSLKSYTALFFLLASIIRGGYKIIEEYINYYMDFCIFTPTEIVGYSQFGLFHRKSKIARTEDIKIVTVDGSGFRRSLLDYGDINIFFEGNYTQSQNPNPGSINFPYVSNVEGIKNKIKKLLDLATAVEHRNHD